MKFIHFGCWNNGFCNKKTQSNGLSYTMKLIDDYMTVSPVDFISIAGDNYYPEKKYGNKKMHIKDLISGFECLPKIVDKYIIFGNHDIEDIIEAEKCTALLLQQKDYSKGTYKLFNDIINLIIDNNLIIMIDTTIYNIDIETKVADTCYKYLFSGLIFDKIKDIITYQNEKILYLIKTNISVDNVIIIGHHPIMTNRQKIGVIITINDGLINLFKSLKDVKNIYYLCADTHFYQYSQITIDDLLIHQYICGTGGAKPDFLAPISSQNINKMFFDVIEQKSANGFIIVESKDKKINIKFVDNEKDFLQKYLKYKSKYLNLYKSKLLPKN